jgi:hypothetical protein
MAAEDRDCKRLASCALDFLASEHAGRAIALRWTEIELFG